MRIGPLTAIWALLFAIVHVYWAAGGEAGMNGEPAVTLGAQLYIGFVAALGLAGATVAIGLSARGNPPLLERAMIVLARTGGAALLLGVAVGTARWLADGGIGDDGAAGLVITLYFLVGGVLFSVLGWRRAYARGRPRIRSTASSGT